MANYKIISTEALIAKFQQALDEKWGYIIGKAGSVWTQALQDKATDEMTVKYGSKWIGKKVSDCSGLFSWAFKQLGSYMYHGSNTMWNKYCTDQGELVGGKRSDGKELKPGTAVFTNKNGDKTHVGLYIGNGYVIEAEGTIHGVIRSKITNSKWKLWGELKYVDYKGNNAVQDEPVKSPVTSYPTIRQGSKGDLVTQLQDMLSKAGSTLQIDGIFGNGTRSAVQAFQRKYGLEADGIVGPKTWAKLLEVTANIKEETAKPDTDGMYNVTIEGLTKADADELVKKYPKAVITIG